MIGKVIAYYPYSGTLILLVRESHHKTTPYMVTEDFNMIIPRTRGDMEVGKLVEIRWISASFHRTEENAREEAQIIENQIIQGLEEEYGQEVK